MNELPASCSSFVFRALNSVGTKGNVACGCARRDTRQEGLLVLEVLQNIEVVGKHSLVLLLLQQQVEKLLG